MHKGSGLLIPHFKSSYPCIKPILSAFRKFYGARTKEWSVYLPMYTRVVSKSDSDHGTATTAQRTLGLTPAGTICRNNLSYTAHLTFLSLSCHKKSANFMRGIAQSGPTRRLTVGVKGKLAHEITYNFTGLFSFMSYLQRTLRVKLIIRCNDLVNKNYIM